MELLLGLVFVTVAGLGTGTSAWPLKVIKDIHLEQYIFFNIVFGIVVYPWLIVLINVPDPVQVISSVGLKTLLISNLASMAWGLASLLYMICAVRIGAALTGAILSGLGMCIGVVLPMVLKGSGLFSHAPSLFSTAGIFILVGLLLMITGVVFSSMAGFGREKSLLKESAKVRKQQASGNFASGLLLAALAGVLSCGLSLSFVYSQGPIIAAVKQQGAGELTANFTVWALACIGGALVNVLYTVVTMTRKRTWNLMFIRKDELLYGALIGVQFVVSIVLMGRGMVLLGILGASVGFGIQQSMQIIGNQLVGFMGGEWFGVAGKPRRIMYIAIAIILMAVVILAYSNTIAI
jgi:hypothetical protein